MRGGTEMIIVNQDKNSFYNTDKILSVSEDSGGISIKTHNASIPVGRYESEVIKKRVLSMLEDFMAGKFEMPKEEEMEGMTDIAFVCKKCNMKNKVPYKTMLKLSEEQQGRWQTGANAEFYCCACGNRTKLSEIAGA